MHCFEFLFSFYFLHYFIRFFSFAHSGSSFIQYIPIYLSLRFDVHFDLKHRHFSSIHHSHVVRTMSLRSPRFYFAPICNWIIIGGKFLHWFAWSLVVPFTTFLSLVTSRSLVLVFHCFHRCVSFWGCNLRYHHLVRCFWTNGCPLLLHMRLRLHGVVTC